MGGGLRGDALGTGTVIGLTTGFDADLLHIVASQSEV